METGKFFLRMLKKSDLESQRDLAVIRVALCSNGSESRRKSRNNMAHGMNYFSLFSCDVMFRRDGDENGKRTNKMDDRG